MERIDEKDEVRHHAPETATNLSQADDVSENCKTVVEDDEPEACDSLDLVGHARQVVVETCENAPNETSSNIVDDQLPSKNDCFIDLESHQEKPASPSMSSEAETEEKTNEENQVNVPLANCQMVVPDVMTERSAQSTQKAQGRYRSKSASSLGQPNGHKSHRGSRVAPDIAVHVPNSISSEDYDRTERDLDKSKCRLQCLAYFNGVMITVCALVFLYSSVFGSRSHNVMGRLQAQTTLLFVILMLILVQATITGKLRDIKALQRYGGVVYTDDIGPVAIAGKLENQKN